MGTARDNYREYLTERLWDWVPAIYRELDATEGGGTLRALLRGFASQAAVAKRSQDRLWDDMFVELADDWAIPYIADLVATRLVSALNPRARRADVAKTVYYRRRKGTLAVLEQLIADMSGWDGKVAEEFRRLARMRHGLDGPAVRGRITLTPEGGLADLRSVRGARLAGDPFDEFHYTPETRRPRDHLGIRGIQTLGFYLYRLHALAFEEVTPRLVRNVGGTRDGFTFDPSGRDTPLFAGALDERDWISWRTAQEWELPRVIDCRLLNEEIFEVGDEEVAWILNGAPIASLIDRQNAAADLRRLIGQRFPGRKIFAQVLGGQPSGAILTGAGVLAGLAARALDPECGSAVLAAEIRLSVLAGPPVDRDRVRGADLEAWPMPVVPDVDLLIDPARGRFVFDTGATPPADLRVRYRNAFGASIGAGAFGRGIGSELATLHWQQRSSAPGVPAAGVLELDDSTTFANPPNQTAITGLVIRAAEDRRPFVSLSADWRLGASGANRELTIDGLWIGGLPGGQLRLEGDFARVTLRFCTLDPGGLDAVGGSIPPCGLVIAGTIDELVLEGSILPGLSLTGAGANVDRIVMRDCIVDAARAGSTGIATPRANLEMARCTVIGPAIDGLCVDVEKLQATDSLIAGRVDVTDQQSGCFRFSARGPLSQVPHPYESHLLDEFPRLFASRRFGDPEYASLSPRAPAGLAEGSEEGCEIGAYCAERRPIKLRSLQTKVEEYMPFGRLPAYIVEN